MRLLYFRDPKGAANFGDDLNEWLWPRLMPGALDDDPSIVFAGIGSIMGMVGNLPASTTKVVFGSGISRTTPRVDKSWRIYCVRGPLTAEALGIRRELAVTDPAILVRELFDFAGIAKSVSCSFMPHYQSSDSGWRWVCQKLRFGYIDPRCDIMEVLNGIARTNVLLTESLHGAIIADSFRVPWIAIRTRELINAFKWKDWCASMQVDYSPQNLMPLWHSKAGQPPRAARLRRWLKLRLLVIQMHFTARYARQTLSNARLVDDRLKELHKRLSILMKDFSISEKRLNSQ